MKPGDFPKWYDSNLPLFEKLRTSAYGIIFGALNDISSDHLAIQSRVKQRSNAISKFKEKRYSTPDTQFTDIIAFRVIVYLESEIEKVRAKLSNSFLVDLDKSIDKRKPKDANSVGYRSLHLICSLGPTRIELPEYEGICEIPFEIQIRTTLEHAWAEIEHKQNYKSSVSLPMVLQRRLNILAGNLELVDRELASIATEAEEYKKRLSEGDKSLSADPISISSVKTVATLIAKNHSIKMEKAEAELSVPDYLIDELRNFGVETVEDLEDLGLEFPANRLPDNYVTTTLGLVRDLMIAKDYKHYFKIAFNNGFGVTSENIAEIETIANVTDVRQWLQNQDIEIIDIDHDDDGYGVFE
jgi:ppGpp synthetase/RelA/SpoT-type nucleotidyltranferase